MDVRTSQIRPTHARQVGCSRCSLLVAALLGCLLTVSCLVRIALLLLVVHRLRVSWVHKGLLAGIWVLDVAAIGTATLVDVSALVDVRALANGGGVTYCSSRKKVGGRAE